jgi:N-methylhydantoinase B
MDPITLSVIGHAFKATVEEMLVNLYRAGHSTIVREVRDVATALFDEKGLIVSMANWLPMLLNAMEPALNVIKQSYPLEKLKPGEALLTNDPFNGGQHVNDIMLFTPIFEDGELVGLSGANVHHLDVGGGAPGSNAKATEVYQEGIVLPPLKISLDGAWEESTFGKVFQANIRVPDKTVGDFNAQIAACRTGKTRLKELVRKYGLANIREFMMDIQDYSEGIIRQAIEEVPDGDYSSESFMEDDGICKGPFTIRLTVKVRGSDILVDFTGTDPQAKGFINIPLGSTYSTVRTTMTSILGTRHLFVNGGAFRPIELKAPLGTLVNPCRPAATRARTSTCYKIFDAVNLALAPVLPEKVIAPGFDCQTGVTLSLRSGERMAVLSEAIGAGVGALHCQDGADGMIMHLTNAMNTPVESVEIEFPFIEMIRYGLVRDSGGPGKYRGGAGIERVYRILENGVVFGLHTDRHHHSAQGLFDGHGGAPGACFVSRNGERIDLGSKVHTTLQRGDVLTVRSGGGAGYGPPHERDRWRIERDLREDFFSPDELAVYGDVSV